MELEIRLINARSKEAEKLARISNQKGETVKSSKATTQNTDLPESENEMKSDDSGSEGEDSEDDICTQSTSVSKVHYGGLMNNKKFLQSLEFAQKSQVVAARALVGRLETLIERINNSGGQQFEKFVRDLDELLDSLKDMISFIVEKSMQRKVKEIIVVLKALAGLLGPRNSIGCLQHVVKWLQLSSTKQIIGSEKSENLVFTLNLQSKRNRRLFQVQASELMTWKTRREMGQRSSGPYGGASSSRGSFGARGHFNNRGGRGGFGGRGGYNGGGRGGYNGGGRGGYSGGGKWDQRDTRGDYGKSQGHANTLMNK